MPPPSPTSPPTIGSVCVVLTAAVKRLALKFVLTTLSVQAVLFFGFGKARYREVYAHDSAVRMWAVVVFVFNFAQAFASQMLSGSADHGTRDLVITSTNVNIVALFMYSVYSAGGSTGDDLAASRRVGGGVSPRMYIMWTLTTPSLIRAVALRARLSSVAQETTERPLPKSGDMRVRGNGGGDRRSHEPVSPRGSSYAAEGNSSPTASSPSWQSGFRDEKVANIASLAMYVTGFLGIARFVWDSCWSAVPLGLLAASLACFGYITIFIWLALSETKVQLGTGLEGARDALRHLFLVTFSLFLVAHLLAYTGFIAPVIEEMAYCWGDILMKVIILGNVTVENVFETRQDLLRCDKEEQTTKMLKQLQHSVESGDKFFSMVSHELRTPIHGIMGLAEALVITPSHRGGGGSGSGDGSLNSSLMQRATEDELQSIRVIAKSGRGLLDLVNNLLAFADLRTGGASLVVEKRPFNIAEIVRHCVAIKSPYLASEVCIAAEFDEDVWDDGIVGTNIIHNEGEGGDSRTITVMCDPMRIEQVITNLVSNAIRHTTVGFVKVRVRCAKVSELAPSKYSTASLIGDDPFIMDSGMNYQLSEIEGKSNFDGKRAGKGEGDNSIVIEVRDSGCGIAERDRKRIFEMFCRRNRRCERYEPGVGMDGGGVGLGLTLCRQLVVAHGSTISVQSVINVGTAFLFSLARADEEQRMCREKHVTGRLEDIPVRADDPLSHVSATHLIERPTNLSQLTHEPSATLGCSTNPSSIELVNSSSWPSESTQRTSTTSPDDHRPPSNKQLGPGDIVRPRVCSLGDESEAKVRERERREFRAQGFRSTTSASSEEPHRASAVRVTSMHLRRRRQRNGRRRDDAISKLFNLKDDTQDDERSVPRKRDRSSLRGMLPKCIVDRLESGQNLIADHHDSVTVLVSNIIGFTELSQYCSTSALMLMLNELFSAFDELLDRHGVYKVETVGDTYMCVTGHDGVGNHAGRMAAFAREMIQVCNRVRQQPEFLDVGSSCDGAASGAKKEKLQIRIGMHSGPIHAGVVGTRLPRYCFFGDTVDTTHCMERTSFPMAVHVSDTTAALLEMSESSVETILLGPRCISKGKELMQTHVLQEGDFLGACKGFAELQDLQMSTSGANQAQEGVSSAPDESIHAGLPDNTIIQTIRGLSITGPSVKGVGGKGEGGNASVERHIESCTHDPHCLKDRIFDTANINVLDRNISKDEDDLWLSMDAGMLRDTKNNNTNCYCCTENAMLSAVDNAVPLEQYTVAAGRASARFRAPSLTSLGTTVLKGDTKGAGALSFLARYINMPVEDMRAMHSNGVTLGTLERLTTDDLLLLGMTIPRDAISLLKATTALVTLRQLGAAATTEPGRNQKLDRASSAKEPLPHWSAGR